MANNSIRLLFTSAYNSIPPTLKLIYSISTKWCNRQKNLCTATADWWSTKSERDKMKWRERGIIYFLAICQMRIDRFAICQITRQNALKFSPNSTIYLFYIILVAANGHLFAQNNYEFGRFLILTFDWSQLNDIPEFKCSFRIISWFLVWKRTKFRITFFRRAGICCQGNKKRHHQIDLNKLLSLYSARKYFDIKRKLSTSSNVSIVSFRRWFILDARTQNFYAFFLCLFTPMCVSSIFVNIKWANVVFVPCEKLIKIESLGVIETEQ